MTYDAVEVDIALHPPYRGALWKRADLRMNDVVVFTEYVREDLSEGQAQRALLENFASRLRMALNPEDYE